jgi:HK97 family phage portal protein
MNIIDPMAATLRNPNEAWLRDSFVPNRSEAGVAVNAQTVRGLPGVWYSIGKIAGHIGSLPLNVYRRVGENSEIAKNHWAYYLLRKRPNDFCTPSVFRETLQHHVLLHGNGRAAIFRDGVGKPNELIIMNPERWAIVVSDPVEIKGIQVPQRKYHVRIDDPRQSIADENVLHVMGLSNDGISGLSVIDAAKTSLGIAIGQQRQRAVSVKNGAKIKFLLSAPVGAFRTSADAQSFIDAFNEYHSGADNVDRVGLLREGITPHSVGQSAQQAQEIEQATFSRQDQALIFAIEGMLGINDKMSYASLEQQNQNYVTNCLLRWATRWEEECAVKLLTSQQFESDEYYFRFVLNALLKGTTKERYEVYSIARQIGALSANEVRKLEDMNERTDAGGDRYDNPAITPGQTEASEESDDDADDSASDDSPAMARLERVIAAQVRSLVNVERDRVNAATSKDNFVAWLDRFYDEWQTRIDTIVTTCKATADAPTASTNNDATWWGIGSQWCHESKSTLLDVAGRTDKRGLAEAVRSAMATWEQREQRLIKTLLEG